MSHNITVEGGSSVRLLTAGKYCDRDIVVTATGGAEDLNDVLTEQEELIATLQDTLRDKASGGGGESGFTDENLLFSEHTITVGEGNGVTNHSNLLTYFSNQVGNKPIIAYSIVGQADTYNQPIFGLGIDSNRLCYRYRGGYISIPSALGNAAYDAALVVGTQYKVYCAKRIT